MAEPIESADEVDPSVLIGAAGMTPEQFFSKITDLGSSSEIEIDPDEDDVPSSVVMRADYDNVRNALAAESEDLGLLTDGNRSIADAFVFMTNAGRIYARMHGIEPTNLTIEQRGATNATLIFGLGG